MKILFMRHGYAEMPQAGRPDFDRRLTSVGVNYIQKEAVTLTKMALDIKRIYHSPLVRATQTAQIMSLGLKSPTQMISELACGCTLNDLIDYFDSVNLPDTVMFVGHQPDLGQMIFALTDDLIQVKPGTVVITEMNQFKAGQAKIIGHFMPEDLI